MNEKMMRWSDDTLIAEYWLNIRMNGEEHDPSDRRYSYEAIQEIKQVAEVRGVDLDSKFLAMVLHYQKMDGEQLQEEYAENFRSREWDRDNGADAAVRLKMEAIFEAADKNSIELTLPPLISY